MEVTVHSRDVEKALRNLKKKLQLDGLFGELKKRRHYEKPSVKKKRKRLEAEKRRRKAMRRARPNGSGRGPSAAPQRQAGDPARASGLNRSS